MQEKEVYKEHIGTHKEKLHHAYVISGERDEVLPELTSFLEKELAIQTTANPDYWYGDYDVFGIAEARFLKDLQQNKATNGGMRVFVISLRRITREAQNALLKIFEEPASASHFFIIIPAVHILLPTLRSRVFVVPRVKRSAHGDEAETFLRMSHKDRLTFVSKFIQKEHGADEAIALLNQLEARLYADGEEKVKSTPYREAFERIYTSRDYLHLQGASIKGVLEYTALTLPVLKK